MAELHAIKIPSQDKMLFAMTESIGEPHRLALLLPGYLDTCQYAHLESLSHSLALRGYFVVRFDPLGTWDSEGEIADYTMTNYILGVGDVLEWVKQRFGKQFDQKIIAGHSLGGVVSILSSVKYGPFDATVAIMSGTKLRTLQDWPKDQVKSSERDIPNQHVARKAFQVPYSFAEDAVAYDIPEIAKTLHEPALCIAGSLDTITSAADVELLSQNTPNGTYVNIPDLTHDYRLNQYAIDRVNETIMNYLQESKLA